MLDKATQLNESAPFIIHTNLKMALHEKINIKAYPAQKELEDYAKDITSGVCLSSDIVDIR